MERARDREIERSGVGQKEIERRTERDREQDREKEREREKYIPGKI